MSRACALVLMMLAAPTPSSGDAVLLLGESYGRFGSVSPLGHAAVYLTRVCASSPTVLRHCLPGETGVVVSRYHRVAGFDWLAVPLIPYLYAVDHAHAVPTEADRTVVRGLRDDYRRLHFQEMIPDSPTGEPPNGDWIQLIGSAYDRTIVGFSLSTTAAQDDELIRTLNGRENKRRFNPNLMKDFEICFGVVKPRSATKLLRNACAIPLAVLQPWIPTSFAAGYLLTGRFRPQKDAVLTYSLGDLERAALDAVEAR